MMTTPCCPKCESTSIGHKNKRFYDWAYRTYCRDCGAILAAIPEFSQLAKEVAKHLPAPRR